jgi:anti-sigma regulatory factor (Ser/Thr protein kinase)
LQGTIVEDKRPHRRAEYAMRPDIQLTLPARAENIAIVRHALGAFGEAFDVDSQILSDIRLAVTEACTNVVVHAYPEGTEGPMEVFANLDDHELHVVVRDEGKGITPRPDSPGLGLGLPLIASLAESVNLGRDEHERTEVQMTFTIGSEHPYDLQAKFGTPDEPEEHQQLAGGPEHPTPPIQP